jgi:hypothetical protein
MNLLYYETAFWGNGRADGVSKAYRCGQVI